MFHKYCWGKHAIRIVGADSRKGGDDLNQTQFQFRWKMAPLQNSSHHTSKKKGCHYSCAIRVYLSYKAAAATLTGCGYVRNLSQRGSIYGLSLDPWRRICNLCLVCWFFPFHFYPIRSRIAESCVWVALGLLIWVWQQCLVAAGTAALPADISNPTC